MSISRWLAALFLIAPLVHAEPLRVGREVPVYPNDDDLAPYTQIWPSVASNDDGFLAVWLESVKENEEWQWVARGARVDSDGKLLDHYGFRFPFHYNGYEPFVAWSGTRWIVASGDEIAFVDRDGRPSSEPVNIPRHGTAVGLACSSTHCLLSWYESATNSPHATLLNEDGSLAVDDISTAGSGAVATDGTRFLVVGRAPGCGYSCPSAIAQFIDDNGTAGSTTALDAIDGPVSVASDGSSWIVASFSAGHVFATWYSADLSQKHQIVLDSNRAMTMDGSDVTVAWTGSEYRVAWPNHTATISPGGELTTFANIPENLRALHSRVAFSRGKTLLVWLSSTGSEFSEGHVEGAFLTSDAATQPFPIVINARMQTHPAIALDADGPLVVWSGNASSPDCATCYSVFAFPPGTAALPKPLLRDFWIDLHDIPPNAIAILGGHPTIVTQTSAAEGTAVRGVSVLDNEVVDEFGVSTFGLLSRHGFAANGNRGAVAGIASDGMTVNFIDESHQSIAVRTISPEGEMVQESPSIAAGDQQFAVTWAEKIAGSHGIIRAARFDSDGNQIGSVIDVSTDAPMMFAVGDGGPAIVMQDTVTYVAWAEGSIESTTQLRLARINADDSVTMFPRDIAEGVGILPSPELLRENESLLLAWQESRCPVVQLRVARIDDSSFESASDIEPSVVAEADHCLSNDLYSYNEYMQFEPRLFTIGDQQMVLYQRTVPELGWIMRLFMRKIEPEKRRGVVR